jgi:hypothetical protein
MVAGMVASLIGVPGPAPAVSSVIGRAAARGMGPAQRQELSLAALCGAAPVSRLAAQRGVSRKFVKEQREKARVALEEAFAPRVGPDQVLFELPVTRRWLERFVLGAVLIGHASDRDVQELWKALLEQAPPSVGSIHNLLYRYADQAAAHNAQEPLSGIEVAGFDEIYQANRPTLVGVDLASTYCFLLQGEAACDGDTWGYHLLELSEKRGLHLQRSIADGGKGLRSGHAQAWPEVPCDYDVFHASLALTELAQYLENRAWGLLRTVDKLQRRKDRTGRRARPTPERLQAAIGQQDQALVLADEVALLVQWMRADVLGGAGLSLAVRQELYDFLVQELRLRQNGCPHRLKALVRTLENQRDLLLGWAHALEGRLRQIARDLQVPQRQVQAVYGLQALDPRQTPYWQQRAALIKGLGAGFSRIQAAVQEALASTPRASSLVENLNSRLRTYFFLWRRTSRRYLELLRFYLNHRVYPRSARPERVGKSPCQLLTGQPHAFWLDMLQATASPQNN